MAAMPSVIVPVIAVRVACSVHHQQLAAHHHLLLPFMRLLLLLLATGKCRRLGSLLLLVVAMLAQTYLRLLPVACAAAAAAAALPGSLQLDRELRSLSSYLPQPLVEVYRGMGMTRDLYAWQVWCG
jgi:hypothetical protein